MMNLDRLNKPKSRTSPQCTAVPGGRTMPSPKQAISKNSDLSSSPAIVRRKPLQMERALKYFIPAHLGIGNEVVIMDYRKHIVKQ